MLCVRDLKAGYIRGAPVLRVVAALGEVVAEMLPEPVQLGEQPAAGQALVENVLQGLGLYETAFTEGFGETVDQAPELSTTISDSQGVERLLPALGDLEEGLRTAVGR